MPATVLLPAPGGPATTQADAGMLMTSEDMAPRWLGPERPSVCCTLTNTDKRR